VRWVAEVGGRSCGEAVVGQGYREGCERDEAVCKATVVCFVFSIMGERWRSVRALLND
jgi:hypothetical protein